MIEQHLTDRGLLRASNQDALIIAKNLYGVADGMGGHNGGETASRVAARIIMNSLRGVLPQPEKLIQAIETANRRIYEMQKQDMLLSGMGTTVSVLWNHGKTAYIAQCGDSRVYLLRNGSLSQITKDHSYVQDLVDAELITPLQARTHPERNLITRAVGLDEQVRVDLFTVEKQPGDRFLICSDGLSGMVPDDTIASILLESSSDEAAVQALFDAALNAGGSDNISLVLCREEDEAVC